MNDITLKPQAIVTAEELTEGDIFAHLGNVLKVASKPEHTLQGIEFEALPLAITDRKTHGLRFDPRWRIELIDYQPSIAAAAA